MSRFVHAAALAAALFLTFPTQAADLPNPPPADWMAQADLFGRVVTLASSDDAQVIAWIQTHQLALSSGYLFDLSRRLLATEKTSDSLEWYAIALIRGQYDSGRCRDSSARRAVSGLARQAAMVARYGHQHAHEFGQAGLRALARPDLFAHTISPDWVCAQGLSGMGGQSAGTIAPTLWAEIEASLRAEFTQQFTAMTTR
ncbi:hypothetical protein [Magnetospirillum sulfuroxidans]|uniref:Secreted protein n=1 Tax=Magnetospirillum sulfuroxidans TaxID=611300 RepID=A0ABS5ID40_9PROT|nr:hypothetical protein [Magnetospirillum sulfuroxidans]MBR9972315.1 hypothetical protein [Magnetospirillum sulfuroxidans]